jgi:hypothetical protein
MSHLKNRSYLFQSNAHGKRNNKSKIRGYYLPDFVRGLIIAANVKSGFLKDIGVSL